MKNIPPLPKSEYLLAVPARPYEPEWTTSETGYTEEQMIAYAESYALAAVLEAFGINFPKMQQMAREAL